MHVLWTRHVQPRRYATSLACMEVVRDAMHSRPCEARNVPAREVSMACPTFRPRLAAHPCALNSVIRRIGQFLVIFGISK